MPGVRVLLCAIALAGCGASTAPAVRVEPGPPGLTETLPDAYRRVCEEQAAYAPAGARVCPPLIPAGRLKLMHAAPFSKQKRYRGGFLADFSSASLSALGGRRIETNGGHWHYGVSWTPAVRRLQVRVGIERVASCRAVRLGAERVNACRVVPHDRGGGLHGGHVTYVWSHGRVTHVISLHGYANEPRARAMTEALIARRRLISARGP